MRAYTTSAYVQGSSSIGRRLILPLLTMQLRCPRVAHLRRDMGGRGGMAHLWHQNLNLALAHFPQDVSNGSKRLMIPSASCYGPRPPLARRRLANKPKSPRDNYLAEGTLDLALPGSPCLMRGQAEVSHLDPRNWRKLRTPIGYSKPRPRVSSKLSSRLRGGSRASKR